MKKTGISSPITVILFLIIFTLNIIGCDPVNNEFTVIFVYGNENLKAISVNHGETIEDLPFPNIPTDTYFGGWFTEKEGQGDKLTTETKIYSNLIVYAYTWGHLFECDPENYTCNWVYAEPIIDYSLPKFYIEGIWSKVDGLEVLSINTYAHFWERYSAECPFCRPAVDPPMPEIIFYPFGRYNSDALYFQPESNSFQLKSYDGSVLEMIDGNNSIHSFSAVWADFGLNPLIIDGLEGRLLDLLGNFIDVSSSNGNYMLLSRP